MFSQPHRGRPRGSGVSSLHRASILLGLVLILLSSVGGSLAGLDGALAQDDPQPTSVPELTDDKPAEEEQKPDEGVPEEPKPTELVTEKPQPTEPITEEPQPTEVETEVPALPEEPPVETKPVETEVAATEAPPLYQGEDKAIFDFPGIAPTPTVDSTTPTPTPPADPEETGSVHIVKYTCPEGYDTSGAGFAILEEECRDDAVLTEFTVSTRGTYSETRAARLTLPPFMQEAKFENVPATSISIAETILPGFGEPIVYCAVGARTVADWMPRFVANGNTVGWTLEANFRLTCYFFNTQVEGGGKDGQGTIVPIIPIDPIDLRPTVPGGFDPIIRLRPTEIPAQPSPLPVVTPPGIPLPEPITGTVRVIKYTCPQNVARTQERAQLNSLCTLSARGVEFSVEGNNGYFVSATTPHGAPSSVRFTGVPFGKVKISETVTPGFGEPLAFCSDDFVEGRGGSFAPVPVDGGDTITWDVRADTRLPATCIFYNIQDRRDVVRVIKFTCGPDVLPNEEYFRLYDQCHENPGPVEFTVRGTGGYLESGMSDGSIPRDAVFTGVPFGQIEISETIPPGYGEPLAFCSDDPGTLPPVPVDGNTVTWELRSDATEALECVFFNRPEGGERVDPDAGVVRITKLTCRSGDVSTIFTEMRDRCRERTDPVEFSVTSGSGYRASEFSRSAGSPAIQEADFTNVPFGKIEISETVPAGYGEPRVWCTDDTLAADGSRRWTSMTVVGGNTVRWDLQTTSWPVLRCLFFNVQETADGLGAQRGWAQEGLDLVEVTGTPEMGVVMPVPTEAVPRLVEPTVISIEPDIDPTAAVDPDPTDAPEPTAIADDGAPILVPVGTEPTEPDTTPVTGRVTVVKLTCAAGIARSDVLSTLFDQCGENSGPVEFSVTGDGGYSWSAFTPDDVRQIVAFADVPFGMIGISESVPPGYGEPLAFCSDSAADGLGTFAPVAVVGGNSITVEHRADAEDELRCGFVNFQVGGTEPEPETGTVTVYKYTCPAGVARTGVDYFLSDVCREDPGPVEFSVTENAGYNQSAFTSDDGSHYVMFAGVPFGDIEISETIPAGFGEPLVFCADTIAVDPREFVPVPVADGNTIAWEHRADAESSLRCGFVNFQEAGEDVELETGTVRISKYTCPGGVARSDDDYLLSEQCREDAGPVEFTVYAGGGFFDSAYTGLGVPQKTEFTDVPVGEIQIEKTVIPAYGEPLAFCSDTPADGAGNYEPIPVTGGDTISWVLRADAEIPLTCLFFNFMDGSEDEGNQFTVTKFDCPEGTDRSSGLPDLGTTCDVVSGIEFTATYGSSSSTQPTDGTGNAQWTDVPIGAWSIQEAIPAGYADPKVYCGPMFTTEAPEVPAPGGLFAGEFTGTGEHLVCTVFNFQDGEDPGTGTVRVSKYTCPAGVAPSEDDYALSLVCLEEVDPVEFSVRDETTYATSLTAAGGVPQEAEFTGVPFGPIEIWETIPAGYGEPLVFCTDTPADGAGNYEPVPVVDGDTIIWTLRADAEISLACLFFNFTDGNDEGNVVTLQKWTCGPETIYSQSSDYYYDACTVAGEEDFGFTLTDAVGSHPQSTSSGWATWTDVSTGAVSIQESIPSAYGEPIVLCSDGTGADFRDAPTGYIDHEFTGSGQEFICDWFNLIGEGSGLTVVKFTCPEGYDLQAAGADPTVDCPEPTNGVTFTLDLPDGSTFVTTTGDAAEGQIQFGGLPAGSYTLTETVPAGIASSFVLDCYGNRMGGIRPYPLAAGDTLVLDINAGEAITCLWYNVPEGDDTSLTLVKYTCSTKTFVSEVDCQIDESGKTFDLVFWNGAAWEYHSTATADGQGRIHWPALTLLEYWLDEQEGDWCHIASEQLSGNGDWIDVYEGQETVVEIYNCDGVPGKPGATPAKYPNTGMPPAERDDDRFQP